MQSFDRMPAFLIYPESFDLTDDEVRLKATATKEAIQSYFREKADLKQDFELVRNPDKLSDFMVEEFKKTECYSLKSEEERQEIINFLRDNPEAYSDDYNILY